MTAAGTWLRRAATALLVLVLLAALLSARVVLEGEEELARSDAAFDRGDLREAILYARRAATLYAPGAPHVDAAYARLTAVALGAEASGDPAMARQAWGAVRAAALESRHVFTPKEAELARANSSLARLERTRGGDVPDAGRVARLLARDDAPRAPFIGLLGAGFGLFACGLGLVARRGVSAEGGVSRRAVLLGVVVALVGVACWTWAVYRA